MPSYIWMSLLVESGCYLLQEGAKILAHKIRKWADNKQAKKNGNYESQETGQCLSEV